MAAVSSLGIGSGLDLNTLLSGLKTAEQIPLAAIQRQQTSYTTKLTAYGQLSSALGSLQTAAAALAKPELFQGVKANSTATDVLTATAASTAQSGTYALNVTQLAQAQSLATAGQADTSNNVGDGETATKVKFEFGTTSGTVFTNDPDDTRTQSIVIDPADSSLAGIAKAINAKTTLGVTASIVNDGSALPNRLVLTSTKTGETSSMRITVTSPPAVPGDPDGPSDAALSSLLTNDPVTAQNLQQTVAAQNTKLTVNGIAVTSATNSVLGAVQDVTMTVSKIGTSTLSVQKDTDSAGNAIATLVNAYNSLQSVAKKLTAFDPASKSGAVLLGDSTLRNIQVGMRSALTSPQAEVGSGLTMLSQIGVSFAKDGTLALDSVKLKAALDGKLGGVATLFSGTAGVGGYGNSLSTLITGYTDATGGVLTAASKGISSSLDSLATQFTATSERADAAVARYKAQFTQLDVMMSRMNQTSTYLTAQFDALNNSKK